MHTSRKTSILTVVTKGAMERGLEIARRGYSVFITNPVNMRKARLKPREYKVICVLLILSNLSTCRINSPGTKVKNTKPRACRKKEIFRSIARSVRASVDSITIAGKKGRIF